MVGTESLETKRKMKQNEKPNQPLAWFATGMLLIAASLASFVPQYEIHHYFFIIANSIWVYVGWLWKEQSVWFLNLGLTLVYIAGLIIQVDKNVKRRIIKNVEYDLGQ